MAFNKIKVMDTARKYVEKGNIDRAIKEYLRIVREDPKDVRVWLKIGDLHAKKGAKQEATETYLKVAKFYSEQGFYLKAVAVYKQILKLDARLVEVNLRLAELYRQLGLLSDAMHHFEMVAAHFLTEGKSSEALATVRQLVDLDPENIATRIKLAELYSKEEMTEEAVVEFDHACESLRAHGRQDDFIKVAERLLWHKPDRYGLARELATMYLRRNDPRRALQKLQPCFKADPRQTETLSLLAQSFEVLGQKPKMVSVLKELARVLQEDGKQRDAESVHRRILNHAPDDADSMAALGMVPEPPPRPPSRASSRVLPRPSGSSAGPPRERPSRTGFTPPPVISSRRSSRMEVDRGSGPVRGDSAFGRRLPSAAPAQDDELYLDAGFDAGQGTAAGEAHEDQITKILSEAEVYEKYGLAQKAIDHLRGIFELDPDNVEASERLKGLLLGQGREDSAVAELMKLAERWARNDEDRARGYLEEILSVRSAHRPALDLASRYGLQLSSPVAAAAPAAAAPAVEIYDPSTAEIELDDLVEIEELEEDIDPLAPPPLAEGQALDPVVATTEPSASTPWPQHLADPPAEVGIEVESSSAAAPMTMDQLMEADGEYEDGGATVFSPPSFGAEEAQHAEAEHEVLDEVMEAEPLDEDISLDEIVTAEEDLVVTEAAVAQPRVEVISLEELAEEESPDAAQPPLDDELEEVEFFVAQEMIDEAREALGELLNQYPDHPVLRTRLETLDGTGESDPFEFDQEDQANLDDSGAHPIESLDSIPTSVGTAEPSLDRSMDAADADTHYDLALAYKEMGLFDEAIGSLERIREAPSMGAKCNLMIGLCIRDKGLAAKAIDFLKECIESHDLQVDDQQAYRYEIAMCALSLGETEHAREYFEKISAVDPAYRDTREQLVALEGGAGIADNPFAADGADLDIDDLFGGLGDN